MTAEFQKGEYKTYCVFALCTAEHSMSYEELESRTIIYFRLCQALLQPGEFRPPWACSMPTLSLSPSLLISLLCTAERMIDKNPVFLHLKTPQFPACNVRQLENSSFSPNVFIKSMIEKLQAQNQQNIQNQDAPIQVIQELLSQAIVAVFIDDQILGCFSASYTDNSVQQNNKIDPIDLMIIDILQKDEYFMNKKKFQYDLSSLQHQDQTIISRTKVVINDVQDQFAAVDTRICDEQEGRHILQMRAQNKQTSTILIIKQLKLEQEQRIDGYQIPKCSLCFIHPFNTKLSNYMTQFVNNKLPDLIEVLNGFCQSYFQPMIKWMQDFIKPYFINYNNPERAFKLQYQISQNHGLLYYSISNHSRGTILAPNLESESNIDHLQTPGPAETSTTEAAVQEEIVIQKSSQMKQRIYNDPPSFQQQREIKMPLMGNASQQYQYVLQITKQFKMVRYQVQKLLQMEHQLLGTGIQFSIERGTDFTRVFWTFYFDPMLQDIKIQEQTTKELNKEQIDKKQKEDKSIYQLDSLMIPCPLSRQQLSHLNQCEEVIDGKRTEYSTDKGGFVGSPQYWQNVVRNAENINKIVKKGNYELYQIQCIFLSLVAVEDIKKTAVEVFKKFARLVWGDYK